MDETALVKELLGFFDKGQISALLVIGSAILVSTQIVKITIKRFYRMPTEREIHLTSLTAAVLFGWFLWPSPMVIQKILAVVLGWGVAYLVATYGLQFTSVFLPRLHRVIQRERRQKDAPLPPGVEPRRDTDNEPKEPEDKP